MKLSPFFRFSYSRRPRYWIWVWLLFTAVMYRNLLTITHHAVGSEGTHMDLSGTDKVAKHYHHVPRRFSEDTRLNVIRGLNIVNCFTAQRVAAWIYHGVKKIGDSDYWSKEESKSKFLIEPADAQKLEEYDTLFVGYAKLQEFVLDFLPHIGTDIVLITTAFKTFLWPDEWLTPLAPLITNHPHVLKWFAVNIGNYTGGQYRHPKVSPFPLGLKPNMGKAEYRNPMKYYRPVLLKNLPSHASKNKTRRIYVSPIRPTSEARKAILQYAGPILGYTDYLNEIAVSEYVVSPDGVHPDCHRHYEAIGLGAIPITQLDSDLYSHLVEAGTIYANDNWNLTELEKILPKQPVVNQNMIFEEYWMEYVEKKANHSLRWWDVVNGTQSYMDSFGFHDMDEVEKLVMGL